MQDSAPTQHSDTQMSERTLADLRALLHAHRDTLERQYSVNALGIFGSYVRGEQDSSSDVDILVEFSKTPNLFQFMDLEQELTAILGVEVDLVSADALKGRIGARIRSEVIWA